MIDLNLHSTLRLAIDEAETLLEARSARDKVTELGLNASEHGDRAAWGGLFVRACFRLGELSRALPKAHRLGARGGIKMPASGKSKAMCLAEAGIQANMASEYERLVGRAPAASATARATLETYLAQTRAAGRIPRLSGLRAAINLSQARPLPRGKP
jgi:hypothetical protein